MGRVGIRSSRVFWNYSKKSKSKRLDDLENDVYDIQSVLDIYVQKKYHDTYSKVLEKLEGRINELEKRAGITSDSASNE